MHDSSCIFEIIQQAQMTYGSLSVKELCQIAGVSRSGYYAWLKAAPIRERQEEQDRLAGFLPLTLRLWFIETITGRWLGTVLGVLIQLALELSDSFL